MKTKTSLTLLILLLAILTCTTLCFSAESVNSDRIPTYEEVKNETRELKQKINILFIKLKKLKQKLGEDIIYLSIPDKMQINKNDRMSIKPGMTIPCIFFKGKDYLTNKLFESLYTLMNSVNTKTSKLIAIWKKNYEDYIISEMVKEFNNFISASDKNKDKVAHILLNYKLKTIIKKINENIDDASIKAEYKTSSSTIFFISLNQYILADKIGVAYVFTFPVRFGYFFKSSSYLNLVSY